MMPGTRFATPTFVLAEARSRTAGLKAALLRRGNPAAQRCQRLLRSGKQIVGVAAVSQDVCVHPVAFVRVQPEAREVLQAQVAVVVDGRVLEPGPQVRRSTG